VYVSAERIGTLCGLRISGEKDRVTGVVVADGGRCYYLDFEQIRRVDDDGVQAFPPYDGREGVTETACDAESAQMRYWLNSLVPDRNGGHDGYELANRFVVYAERDRGQFTVTEDQELAIDACGCGMLEYVDVDAQGYIDHVTVRVDEVTAARADLRPLPKRSSEEILQRAHAGMAQR
jgi:hypothetical protein